MKNLKAAINDIRKKLDELERHICAIEENKSVKEVPHYMKKTLNQLKGGPKTLRVLSRKIGKRESTIYFEIARIRKAGYTVDKQYSKRSKAHQYFVSA